MAADAGDGANKAFQTKSKLKTVRDIDEQKRLEQRIAALQMELNKMEKRHGFRHPKVLRIMEQLDPLIARLMHMRNEARKQGGQA